MARGRKRGGATKTARTRSTRQSKKNAEEKSAPSDEEENGNSQENEISENVDNSSVVVLQRLHKKFDKFRNVSENTNHDVESDSVSESIETTNIEKEESNSVNEESNDQESNSINDESNYNSIIEQEEFIYEDENSQEETTVVFAIIDDDDSNSNLLSDEIEEHPEVVSYEVEIEELNEVPQEEKMVVDSSIFEQHECQIQHEIEYSDNSTDKDESMEIVCFDSNKDKTDAVAEENVSVSEFLKQTSDDTAENTSVNKILTSDEVIENELPKTLENLNVDECESNDQTLEESSEKCAETIIEKNDDEPGEKPSSPVIRRSSRIKTISVLKKKSKGRGLVRNDKHKRIEGNNEKEPSTESGSITENQINKLNSSVTKPISKEQNLSESSDCDLKPVKVKSRWRRTSELEMALPGAVSDGNKRDQSANQNDGNVKVKSEEELQFEKDMEERLRQFVQLHENEYHCEKAVCREAKKMLCDCFLTSDEIERGEMGCGEDCLNRLLMIECGPNCVVGNRCTNKRFQESQYATCKVFKTEKKGFGIQATMDMAPGDFIMEYVGEVLNTEQFEKRAEEYSNDKNRHYYFMALKSDTIIDATNKGNVSRFINHSCDPNAETQKWTVNGELRIGFFSKREIMKGEEITFDYQFQRYGKEAQRCFCEASNCRGWIGEEPDSDESDEASETESESDDETTATGSPKATDEADKEEQDSKEDAEKKATKARVRKITKGSTDSEDEEWIQTQKAGDVEKTIEKVEKIKKKTTRQSSKKSKKSMIHRKDIFEDLDLDEEIQVLSRTGLKNQAHTLTLSRLMVRAKEIQHRIKILSLIQGGEVPCRRLFLDYHGLRLVYSWMCDSVANANKPNDNKQSERDFLNLRLEILNTLTTLPISNKTMLQDSKVLPTVEKWSKKIDGAQKSPNSSPSDDSEASRTPIFIDEATGLPVELTKVKEEEVKTVPKTESVVKEESVDSKPKIEPDSGEVKSEVQEKKSDEHEEYMKCVNNLKEKIVEVAKKLLKSWQSLKEVFRIPKRERIEQMKEHEREANRGYSDPNSERRDVKHRFKACTKESAISPICNFGGPNQLRSVIKKVERKSNNTTLSKYERRQQFAEQVKAEENKKRLRAGRELWRAHSHHCSLMGYDPLTTPAPDPTTGMPMYYDPVQEVWKTQNLDPSLAMHPMLTPQTSMMTPQSGMMTPQTSMMTSQAGMMTQQTGMMTQQTNMMIHPGQPTYYPHPGLMIPDQYAQQHQQQMMMYPPFQNNIVIQPMQLSSETQQQMIQPPVHQQQQMQQMMMHNGQPVMMISGHPQMPHFAQTMTAADQQMMYMMSGQNMIPPQPVTAPSQERVVVDPQLAAAEKILKTTAAADAEIETDESPGKTKKSKKKDKKKKDKDKDSEIIGSANPYKIPPPEDLPPGWLSAIDQSGRIYYYHSKRRISQWLPPEMCKNIFGRFNQFQESSPDNSDDDEPKSQRRVQFADDGQKETAKDDSDSSDSDNLEDTLLMRQVHGNIQSKTNTPKALRESHKKSKHEHSIKVEKSRVVVLKAEAESTTSSDDPHLFCDTNTPPPKGFSKQSLDSPVYKPKRLRELQPVATSTGLDAFGSPMFNSDSSRSGEVTPQPEDTMSFGEEAGIGCDSSGSPTKERKRLRRRGLVTEILISPRSEHDRIYHKVELKRYKENKEKLKLKKYVKMQRERMKVQGIEALNMPQPPINIPLPDLPIDITAPTMVPQPVIDESDELKKVTAAKRKSSSESRSQHHQLQKRSKASKDDKEQQTRVKAKGEIPFLFTINENSKEGLKIKEQFRVDVAKVIVSQLNHFRKPDCLIGRITNTKDFKHLAKKLTHFVMVKELKHCKAVEELTFNESVKVKTKEFVKKYMAKYGDTYVRPPQEVD